MILSILLTILKVIGIILASILGLIILILLLVLFVPIRYKGAFARTGIDDDPPIDARAQVSWLLHIVHISVKYPSEPIGKVRIFGIPIMQIPPKKKKEKPDKEKKTKKDSINDNDVNDNNINDNNINDNNEFVTDDSDEISIENDTDVSSEDKETIFSRIANLCRKIKYTIKNAYDKIISIFTGVHDKTNKIKKDIHYYHTILTSDLFDRTLEKTKKKIAKLLKEILPRKLEISMEVGFDDPYTTGELLAITGILYPLIGDYVHIVGNFEESIIRGAGRFKGKIYGFSFVKIGLYYLFDRDLKRLIRLLKKEEKKHGRKQ